MIDMLVTKSEFAKMCGVSRQAIHKAVERGSLKIVGDDNKISTKDRLTVDYMTTQKVASTMEASDAIMDRGEIETEKLKQQVIALELSNAKSQKVLVSSKLVDHLIQIVDTAFNKIMADGKATMVPRLHTKIQGKCTVEEAQTFFSNEISKYLKPAKSGMIQAVKKYDRDN